MTTKLAGYNYKWDELGTRVVINYGFARGVMGEISGFNGNSYWSGGSACRTVSYPMYEVTFVNPQNGKQSTCTYREEDLI